MSIVKGIQSPVKCKTGTYYYERADKYRKASKKRRDLEHDAILALARELPLTQDVISQLDKASILRLTAAYFRLKLNVGNGLTGSDNDSVSSANTPQSLSSSDYESSDNGSVDSVNKIPSPMDTTQCQQTYQDPSLTLPVLNESKLFLDTSDSFLLYVNSSGIIEYISEHVKHHLGISQVDLIGKHILEYIHQKDHKEFRQQFIVKPIKEQEINGSRISLYNQDRQFFIHIQCQYTEPEKHLKTNGYLLLRCSGRLQLKKSLKPKSLVCLCRPVSSEFSPYREIRLPGNTFVTRHSLDLKYIYVDPRVEFLIGYEPEELNGKPVYQFHYPLDVTIISECHSHLIADGKALSKYYRFLGKTGVLVWIQSRASILYNTNREPQYIVCINTLIGKEKAEKALAQQIHSPKKYRASNRSDYLPVVFDGLEHVTSGHMQTDNWNMRAKPDSRAKKIAGNFDMDDSKSDPPSSDIDVSGSLTEFVEDLQLPDQLFESIVSDQNFEAINFPTEQASNIMTLSSDLTPTTTLPSYSPIMQDTVNQYVVTDAMMTTCQVPTRPIDTQPTFTKSYSSENLEIDSLVKVLEEMEQSPPVTKAKISPPNSRPEHSKSRQLDETSELYKMLAHGRSTPKTSSKVHKTERKQTKAQSERDKEMEQKMPLLASILKGTTDLSHGHQPAPRQPPPLTRHSSWPSPNTPQETNIPSTQPYPATTLPGGATYQETSTWIRSSPESPLLETYDHWLEQENSYWLTLGDMLSMDPSQPQLPQPPPYTAESYQSHQSRPRMHSWSSTTRPYANPRRRTGSGGSRSAIRGSSISSEKRATPSEEICDEVFGSTAEFQPVDPNLDLPGASLLEPSSDPLSMDIGEFSSLLPTEGQQEATAVSDDGLEQILRVDSPTSKALLDQAAAELMEIERQERETADYWHSLWADAELEEALPVLL